VPRVIRRRLLAVLAALAAARVAIALAVLAAEGRTLPLVPAFDWHGFDGDANGYYSAARQVVSTASTPAVAAGMVVSLGVGAGLALLLRRRGAAAWSQFLAVAAGVAGAATSLVAGMTAAGAPVIGWPLLWAVPLAPLRVLGEPGTQLGWAVGATVSLACVAAGTIATGLLGRWASGRDDVAMGAAALFAAWPLLTGPIAGEQAWENGTWLVDAGLHLYTEPVSTALVTTALALLVRPQTGRTGLVGAGALLGFATAVKLTNGLIVIALLPIVAWRRGLRAAAILAAGAVVFAPVVAAYWNKGYTQIYAGSISASDRPWALDYAVDNWRDSLLFTPTMLLVLAPLAIAGAAALRDRGILALLGAVIAVTALTYTVYYVTAIHPRFLFVALPPLFVLEARGGAALVEAVRLRAATSARRST
jgi:hypothetical protein